MRPFDIRCPGSPKSSGKLLLVGNEDCFRVWPSRRLRHFHIQKAVLIRRPGFCKFVTRRYFNHTFEGTVTDLDDEEFAFARARAIRSLAADHEAIAIDG